MKSKLNNYSELLKLYREQNFLTQEELANKLGVSFATVNRWENSHFEPTMKTKKLLDNLFKESNLKGYK